MKKYKIILQFLIFGIMIILFQHKASGQFVTVEGKQFKLNGNNFYPRMLNYGIDPIKFTDGTRYISASHTYGDSICFECSDKSSCNLQLDTDFKRIRSMNFNAIRMCGPGPIYDPGTKQLYFHFIPIDFNGRDSILINPLDTNDMGMSTILPLYDSILSIASKDTLKVMFIIRGWNSLLDSTEVRVIDQFLNRLSTHFATSQYNEALFAYDLMNEPAYSIVPRDSTKTKQQACEIISTWYNTIKSKDTHHLVTMGGSGKADVYSFDPAVLKLDFITLHYYPEFQKYENRTSSDTQQIMRERSINELYWMQQNCPIPWMIGETGFSASKNFTTYDGLDGTLADQDSFAIVSLRAACNCGASGYSWFDYQDRKFHNIGASGFGSDYVGLLELWSGYPNIPPDFKPAAQEFRNFTWGVTGPCPVSYSALYDPEKLYYNPGRHPYNPVQGGRIITGRVIDQDGNPIRDALIIAHTLIDTTGYVTDVHVTHSDSIGHFEVIPYDWIGPDYNGQIVNIKISATGANVKNYGWKYNPIPQDTIECRLQRVDYNYDTQTSGHHVTAGTTKSYRGYNTLTASDITVENTAVAEFIAPQGVTINGEFTAELGSDVYIYCAATVPDCSEFPYPVMLKNSKATSENTENETKNEMEVDPALPSNSLFIFPNPSNGVFTVQLNGSLNEEQSEINVFNIYGREVFSKPMETGYKILDLSSLPKGIYYIQITNAKKTFNRKIIFE